MKRYQDGRLSFEPPREWVLPTMVAFAAPDATGPSVVMSRERLREGRTMQAFLREYIDELRTKTGQLRVDGVRERDVGGRRATQIDVSWKSNPIDIAQSAVFVEPPPGGWTTTGPRDCGTLDRK